MLTLLAGTVTWVPLGPLAAIHVAPPSVQYWRFCGSKSAPAVAEPLEAVRSITMAVDDGLLSVSGNWTGLPSVALALPIVTVCAGSLSMMVPVPELIAVTAPEIGVPERLKV